MTQTAEEKPASFFERAELERLGFGYDLDCGGYEFENPEGHPELRGLGVVIWDSIDPDYVPWVLDDCDFYSLSCPIYVFHPYEHGFGSALEGEWPIQITTDNGWVWDLISHGALNETDRDCHCHGKKQCPNCEQEVPYDDASFCPACGTAYLDEHGKLRQNAWEFTGNCMDKPYPDCNRCEGDGFVISDGGKWALYGLHEEDDDEEETDEEDEGCAFICTNTGED
jgi:hypothetical protein